MKITEERKNFLFWILVIFFLVLPIITEMFLPIKFFSSYWFISIPSIFIVLFRFGPKFGITILCVSSLTHIFWEVCEFIWMGKLLTKEEFEMIIIVNLVKVSVTILTTIYLVKINKHRQELQILNEKLQKMAQIDHLTGLPNRLMLEAYIDQVIKNSVKYNERFSVMFLDLDRFKEVNDTLGHAIGDSLLIQVAERLQRSVRKHDLVFRLAGDEFVIVLKEITKEECKNVAERIINNMSDSFILEGMKSSVSFSIGIGFYPENGISYEEILKSSDQAMYLAKLKGKNNFQFA